MICEQCQQEGKRSRIYPGMSWTTAMGVNSYYDEGGTFHLHDPNITHAQYSCSSGHEWTVENRRPCPAPACDFNR